MKEDANLFHDDSLIILQNFGILKKDRNGVIPVPGPFVVYTNYTASEKKEDLNKRGKSPPTPLSTHIKK